MAQAGGRPRDVNSAHRHRLWWGKWGDGRFALTLPKGRSFVQGQLSGIIEVPPHGNTDAMRVNAPGSCADWIV